MSRFLFIMVVRLNNKLSLFVENLKFECRENQAFWISFNFL